MADHPRFGPAGVPPRFKKLKKPASEIPSFLKHERLDAFEYQAVRWGLKPQIKEEEAKILSANARKEDIWLTMHASYFINLCGKENVVQSSKERLLACATAADWMDAKVVVFHPGFYGKISKSEALTSCINAALDVIEQMKSLGIKNVKLGPETMGKQSQFGSLDEILALCEQDEQLIPVIDWAHLHARDLGRFKSISDFQAVINEIEKRLGLDIARNLHCHYTPVEFTQKGEKRHHSMGEAEYGPDFKLLAELIAELGIKPVMISESPALDIDAMKMRDILIKELRRIGKVIKIT